MSNAMQFSFEKVLFFGRSVDEYRTMFNFVPEDYRGKRVLDCCGGPAALTATAPSWGIDVTACDPLYASTAGEMRARADEDAGIVDELQAKTLDLFDDAVRRAARRRDDMNTFLADFESGKQAGRYVTASLPELPFADNTFDLTLCGNFLFLYSSIESGGILNGSPFDYSFHLKSLRELSRVTKGETRLYPLNGPEVERHGYLDSLIAALTADGITCELVSVEHKDIKTAVHLLSLRPRG
jgi:hypothetical protein